MATIEHELKFILTQQRFREVMDLVTGRLPNVTRRSVVQINHYYDTPELTLHKRGVTCRIRQKGEQLQGQIKRHDFGTTNDSREETFPVDRLPQTLSFEGQTAFLLGNLVTHRESLISPKGFRFDFDTNCYWGICDYELEIEYRETALSEVMAVVSALGLESSRKCGGKFSRFLAARENFLRMVDRTAVQGV